MPTLFHLSSLFHALKHENHNKYDDKVTRAAPPSPPRAWACSLVLIIASCALSLVLLLLSWSCQLRLCLFSHAFLLTLYRIHIYLSSTRSHAFNNSLFNTISQCPATSAPLSSTTTRSPPLSCPLDLGLCLLQPMSTATRKLEHYSDR